MKKIKGFPQTILRLPRYYHVLRTLRDQGIETVTSSEMAPLLHQKSAQVRVDVSRFGGTGVSCLGYSVGGLLKALTSLLGIDREFSVILVGTDGAGSAFLESEDFDSCGLVFQGVFDLDVIPDGHTVKGCPVQDLAGVASFIKTHHTDIAILAVGSNMARSTAALLIDAGIRAVWNLTDKDIDMDPSVIVENAGILDSFHILNYRMNLRETDPSRQVCREP